MSLQPVLEVGSSNHACLKDLCSQDKKKVSNLIKQVVELKQERVGLQQQLQQALNGQTATTDKLAGLTESNKDLVRENANLRAKLLNAATLLRIYQHKVQVLEASLAHVHTVPQPAASLPLAPQALQAVPAGPAANASTTCSTAGTVPAVPHEALALMPAQAMAAITVPTSAAPSPAQPPFDHSNEHPFNHQQPQALQQPQHQHHQHHHQHHQHHHQHQRQVPTQGASREHQQHPATSPAATTPAPVQADWAAGTVPCPASEQAATHQQPNHRPPTASQPAPGTPASPAGDCAASDRSLLTDSPSDASLRSLSPPAQLHSPAPAVHPAQASGTAVTSGRVHGSSTQLELLALAQAITAIAKSVPTDGPRNMPQQQQHSPGTAASASAASNYARAERYSTNHPSTSTSSSHGSTTDPAVRYRLQVPSAGIPASHQRRQDVVLGSDQDMQWHSSTGPARKLQLQEGNSHVTRPGLWMGDHSTPDANHSLQDVEAPTRNGGNPVESLADLIYEMEQLGSQETCYGTSRSGLFLQQVGPSYRGMDLVEENDVLAMIAAQEGTFSCG